MNSPDERRLEVEESVELPVDVVGLSARLLLLLLLFLLFQEQLLLLLTLQQLLKLQASTTRLILVGRLHKLELRTLVTPPEVCGRQKDEQHCDDAERREDANQYNAT